MQAILENILVMILTIVVPLTCVYLLLVLIGWGLKRKSGGSEQQGLTDLWIAAQSGSISKTSDSSDPDEDHSNDRQS